MLGGISGWQLLILLLIVVLVFGTKRLRNIGSDLGSAVRGFRKGMEEEPEDQQPGQLGSDERSNPATDEHSPEKDAMKRTPGDEA